MCGRTDRIEFVFSEGTHKVKFYGEKSASGANVLCYEVNYNGKQVVKRIAGRLNWTIVSGKWLWGCVNCPQPAACWMDNLEVDLVAYGSHMLTGHHLRGT